MREIVEDFRQRVSGNAQLEELWTSILSTTTSSVRARAVGANALALLTWSTAQDVRHLGRIVATLGGRAAAEAQERVLVAIDPKVGRPLTTALIRRLGDHAWGDAVFDDPEAKDAAVLRSTCAEAVIRLLMVPDGAAPEVPAIHTSGDLLAIFTHGDLPTWRHLIANNLRDPWSGDGGRRTRLLDSDLHRREQRVLEDALDLCRRFVEEDERRTVADHIRRTIARTGLTQREFASLLGTSPSRLSTYATGAVTPSATMLLRINRVAKRARAARDDDQPR